MVQHRQSGWPPRPSSRATSAGDADERPALPNVTDPEPVSAQERESEPEGSFVDWDTSPTQVQWRLPLGPSFDDLDEEDAPDTIPTPPPDPE